MARDIKTRRVVRVIEGKSMTRQSEAEAADINVIVRRGIIPPDPDQMTFGDFSDGESFQIMHDRIAAAKSEFESLPSEIRAKFSNNPAFWLDYLADSSNDEEAIELGLKNPVPVQTGEEASSSAASPEPGKTKAPTKPKKAPSGESADDPSTTPS